MWTSREWHVDGGREPLRGRSEFRRSSGSSSQYRKGDAKCGARRADPREGVSSLPPTGGQNHATGFLQSLESSPFPCAASLCLGDTLPWNPRVTSLSWSPGQGGSQEEPLSPSNKYMKMILVETAGIYTVRQKRLQVLPGYRSAPRQ